MPPHERPRTEIDGNSAYGNNDPHHQFIEENRMDDHPIIRASLVTAGLNLNTNGGSYRPGIAEPLEEWQESTSSWWLVEEDPANSDSCVNVDISNSKSSSLLVDSDRVVVV